MKRWITRIWMLVLGIVFAASPVFADEQPAFKTQLDKVNYGIGVNVIRNFKQQGIDIDLDMVIKGMKDALSGEKLIMSEGDLRRTMNDFSSELRRKQAIARSMAATDNKREGEAFQADNKKKEGTVILPSGLQYQVIKASEGKKPSDADMVEFHYRGSFVNGIEFDNTYDSGKPMVVKVQEGGGMRGWSEALKLMPVGSTWRVVIPPQLAYGDKGKGRIGPNETVIFDIELLAIK